MNSNTPLRQVPIYTMFQAMEGSLINRQPHIMIPKKLTWTFIGRTNANWVGTLPDNFPLVRFTLERQSGEKYLIVSNLDGIRKTSCIGLENAKQQAQELFDGYALSLFKFNNSSALNTKLN